MATQSVSSLLRLPRQKRMEIAEALWLSVADEQKMPIPEKHRQVVEERLVNYRTRKSRPISHDELMRRVRAS